jgi:hypothetical protein
MYKLEPKQLETILNYLATKPWAEVNNLINILYKLEKVEDKKENYEHKQ